MEVVATGLTTLAQQAPPAGAGGSTTLLIWAIVLIGAAAALLVVEIFVPSGGIIAVVSALCLVVGIVMLFGVNTYLGLATSGVSLVAIPFLLFFAMKLWPHTPIGRRLTLGGDAQAAAGPATRQGRPSHPAVGAVGRAATDLRPVGVGVFDGQRVECLADQGMIVAGTRIQIVASQGMETKVRPVDASAM